MSASEETLIPPGTKLAHYEIRRLLGTGAMGTVYEANDEALDRSVAVKVLKARIAEEPAFVDRFFREARAAARVNHPNLVHVYFVGRDVGGRAFFSMEVVLGKTLEEYVQEHGPLELAEAADLIAQAARGLGAAHGMGVVHRDVKPSNLLRRTDGVLKVTDFGLARSMDADVNASSGGLTGTPTFMSPEQCRGRAADIRTDIYSLGLVFSYLLTGKPPFGAQSLGELINSQLNEPLPSVVKARPELPPGVDRILAKMCAKDPDARFATMGEVEAALETLRPRDIHLAPIVTRGVAASIDFFTAFALGPIVYFGCAGGISKLFELGGIGGAPVRVTANVVGVAATTVVLALLLIAPEMRWQTSLGKHLMGLRVVRADGNIPSKLQILGRAAIRYPIFSFLALQALMPDRSVASEVFDFGGAILQIVAVVAGVGAYFLKQGRTLSDLVTKTRVAYSLGQASQSADPARA